MSLTFPAVLPGLNTENIQQEITNNTINGHLNTMWMEWRDHLLCAEAELRAHLN